jgi:hypothetical protein
MDSVVPGRRESGEVRTWRKGGERRPAKKGGVFYTTQRMEVL